MTSVELRQQLLELDTLRNTIEDFSSWLYGNKEAQTKYTNLLQTIADNNPGLYVVYVSLGYAYTHVLVPTATPPETKGHTEGDIAVVFAVESKEYQYDISMWTKGKWTASRYMSIDLYNGKFIQKGGEDDTAYFTPKDSEAFTDLFNSAPLAYIEEEEED